MPSTGSPKLILPIHFAAAVHGMLAERQSGTPTIAAARRACLLAAVPEEWQPVLIAFITNSPVTAEAWASKMLDESLARAEARTAEREARELAENGEPFRDDRHLRAR